MPNFFEKLEASLRRKSARSFLLSVFKRVEGIVRIVPLPSFLDKDWYEKVLDTLERAKLIYSNQEHEVAARLFYYLIKDHNFVDGNKRTGIIITYLFLIMNGYTVTSPIKIKALAKKVARSHGSSRQDKWIEKITAQLEAITIIY